MIAGYEKIALLHEGRFASVARCRRVADGTPVIIKVAQPGNAQVLRLRHEYNLLQRLAAANAEHVAHPLELRDDEATALVLADSGGVSLREAMQQQPLTLRETLHVAVDLCSALIGIHQAQIIHKDINPNNIVYKRSAGKIEIIDFGIATRTPREQQTADTLRAVEGTLSYASPEQTGRINRLLDYRTDFYSLGVTLYEMLSGCLPFSEHDIGKLVYAILTKTPPPLANIAPQVPEVLARIVGKLLEKEPERRYQSAFGLQHDLRACLTEYQASGSVALFPLATVDRAEHLEIPQKLYGRRVQREALLDAYKSIARGGHAFVLVHGPSGVGKSALVNEVQTAIGEHDGLFAAGKFDQLHRHVPFSALRQAMTSFVRRILMEPSNVLTSWCRLLQGTVGNIGQALLDIAPDMEVLIGKQRPIPDLGPKETEQRLLLLLLRVVQALCRTQPLVLFFDDLQWADASTLRLLDVLAKETQYPSGLLLIAALRESEDGHEQPLRATLAAIRGGSAPVHDIDLQALCTADVSEMVRDATGENMASVQPLAELLVSKTGGNPFFVHAFLLHLYEKELLRFNTTQGRWTWLLADIWAADITDNVVTLLLDKLRQMPADALDLLSTAACFGNQFSLRDLAIVAEQDAARIAESLSSAVQMGMLVPMGLAESSTAHDDNDRTYKFSHDRIQQAAYAALSQSEAIQHHCLIGKRLLENRPQDPAGDWVFAVTDHLNSGRSLLSERRDQRELFDLNLAAAREAKRASAQEMAVFYLRTALAIITPIAESGDEQVLRQLQQDLAESEFLTGNSETAMQRLEGVLATCRSADERADVQYRRVVIATSLEKFDVAVQAGLAALRALGYKLSASPSNLHVLRGFLRLRWAMRGKKAKELVERPLMTEALPAKIIKIFCAMIQPAYFENELLYAMLNLGIGYITLRFGNSRMAPFGYGSVSVIHSQINRQSEAVEYGLASRDYLHRADDVFGAGAAVFGVNGWANYLVLTPEELVKEATDATVRAIEEGDPFYASTNAVAAAIHALYNSVGLAQQQLDETAGLVRIYGRPPQQAIALVVRQTCLCMQGLTKAPNTLSDADYDDAAHLHHVDTVLRGPIPAFVSFYRVLPLWVHRDLEGCVRELKAAARRRAFFYNPGESTTTLALLVVLCFTGQGQRTRQRPSRWLLRQAVARLKSVAIADSPRGQGMHWLAVAELAAAKGEDKKAAEAYEHAIGCAAKCRNTFLSAMALECAGRFYVQRGATVAATAYLAQALQAYQEWGGETKVRLLREEFSFLTVRFSTLVSKSRNRTGPESTTAILHTELGDRLDAMALIRTSRALSEEVVLEKLVEKILTHVSESAGATRAALAVMRQGELSLIADSQAQHPPPPQEVLQYVSRSLQPVVIDDLSASPTFKGVSDAHPVRAKSVLCAPMLHQGKLTGVIYLENDLTTRAFTSERLLVVDVLAAQAAVACENARLYEHLEEVVAERTQQLQEAHTQLLRLERASTEVQMAGGFAHEMRNALSPASYVLTAAGFDGTSISPLLCISRERLAQLEQIGIQHLPEAALAALKENLSVLNSQQDRMGDLLRHAGTSVTRGLRITHQALSYAQAGKVLPAVKSLLLNETVTRVITEMQSDLQTRNIEITTHIPAVRAAIGEDHAYTIIQNLLMNARDAVSTLSDSATGHIEVRIDAQADDVQLTVLDNGPGIPEDMALRLFKPFFSTKGAHGTGLGLALSRKLAELYGGKLQYSAQAPGTAFTLILPQVHT